MAISIDATFSGEPSLALLIGLTLVFRLAGAAARAFDAAPVRFAGWLLAAVAAWLAVAAAGGFAPVGLALLIGGLFVFVDRFERRGPPTGARSSQGGQRRWIGGRMRGYFGNTRPVWALGELVVVCACGWVSIPSLAMSALLVTVAAMLVAGIVIDLLLAPLARAAMAGHGGPARLALATCALLPLLLWVAHGLIFPQQRADFRQEKAPQIRAAVGPFFAVARADVGTAVELNSGAVGWLSLPPGPPPYRPAIVFHGADEEGSYQRGALFLRRTLRGLGFAVLAVDAPGFGASAPPAPLRDLEPWDPEPVSLAAARYLLSVPGVEGSILAVGHSMGATRALRFLDVWIGASAAVVAGATVMPPPSEDERLYGRMLDDFDIEDSGLPPPFLRRVRHRYFNNDEAATSLAPGHAPVLFLRFAYDYANIIEGRNELFAMIPGRKVQWELRSDHQFASSRVRGVLIGDWRLMGRLRVALQRFLDGRSPRTDRPLRFTPRR